MICGGCFSQHQPACGLVGALWASRNGSLPQLVLVVHQLVLLLTGKVLYPLPQQKIVLHPVEFDTCADIVFELALKLSGGLPL